MALTEKKKKSNKRSDNKNSYRFSIITTKKRGQIIENYIYNIGESKNNFFMKAVGEKIERDTGKSFDEFLKENEELKGDTESTKGTDDNPNKDA